MPQFRPIPSFDDDKEKERIKTEIESIGAQPAKPTKPLPSISNTTGRIPIILLSGPIPTSDTNQLAALVQKSPALTQSSSLIEAIKVTGSTDGTTGHITVISADSKLRTKRSGEAGKMPSPQKSREKKPVSRRTIIITLVLATILLFSFVYNVPFINKSAFVTYVGGGSSVCRNGCQVQNMNFPALSQPTLAPVPTPIPTVSGVTKTVTQDPSGQAMPVGDIPGWHQIFAENFTTNVPLGSFPAAVSNEWGVYPDGAKDTSKNGTYYPSKVVSIQNGIMNLYIHTENGVHMVAALEPKLPGAVGQEGGLLYGRYAIRFRSDPIPGYKTAWLLWPDSENWPQDGEMDFPEGGLDGGMCAFMHHQGGTSGSDQDAYCTQIPYTSWHTAVIEWTPGRVNFILDGTVIGSSTNRIPNTPMHWVIQTETDLSSTPPSDNAAGNIQIAWVTAYTPA
jgi:hypothetical protein